jgi:hypothetical protein
VSTGIGDRLLGLFVPGVEARAAYQCSPVYQAGGSCFGYGYTYAECECRSGRTYRRWITVCGMGGGSVTSWTRTTLAC